MALIRWLLPLMTIAVLALAPAANADGKRTYYVSLGDSLAAGVQPTGPPPYFETDDGYADQLHASLAAADPKLEHVQLGCPGESTSSLRFGSQLLSFTGSCGPPEEYRHRYPHKTQLDEAVAFLRAHKVALLTIDLGANDVGLCFATADRPCFDAGLDRVRRNLTAALDELHAADPGVRIVGMTYYNPFLGSWLEGPGGRAFALFMNGWIGELNGTLEAVYASRGVQVADVAGAFGIEDFGDADADGVPDNVERACKWTWWCSAQDVHANTAGYGVIAAAFEAEL